MKKIIYITLVLASIVGIISCVDDYQDANPPRLKDGPFFDVSLSSDTVVGGNSVNFTINVIDAPGGIDSVSISNPQRLGTYSIDNLDALQGNTQGEITGSFVSPTTMEGELGLMFEVFDAQVDEKGEDASKSSAESEILYVKFPGDAPEFDISVDVDTVIRGETRTLTLDVSNADGGVDTVMFEANIGEIDISNLTDLYGEESGSVDLTYTADPEYVGEVAIMVRVIDELQQRAKVKNISFDAVYEFPAPTVQLSIDNTQFKPYEEIDLSVDIDAPGEISAIAATSVEVTSSGDGDPLGTVELDETEAGDALGNTTATVNGTFMSTSKGFIKVMVTVTDTQGRETTDFVEVTVLPCDNVDLAGMYRSVASGESGSAPEGEYTGLVDTVEVSGDPGLIFEVSDLSFGLFELQGFDPEPGTIQVCETDIVAAESANGFVTVQSCTINMDGTIEIEWDNEFGDSGNVVLTPIP